MKKKLSSSSGITLVELLIGIVISVIMMAALFSSYTAVNNSYSQVIDKSKISQTGRNVTAMIIKDIRIAGFVYFGDNLKANADLIPIKITKASKASDCDKIDLVYGDRIVTPGTPPTYKYVRYKITYECKESEIIDKKTNRKINAYALYKSKSKWDGNKWHEGGSTTDDMIFKDELVVDHVQDVIFLPIDNKGKIIDPIPTTMAESDKIKIVDVAIFLRSTKEFYKKPKLADLHSLKNTSNRSFNDKYLRESMVISAHTRNMGLQ